MQTNLSAELNLSWLFFVAAPRTSMAGLQYTVTALPNTNVKKEMLDSLLSKPSLTWAVASKDKLSNEIQLSDYSMSLLLGCPNMTHLSSWKSHYLWAKLLVVNESYCYKSIGLLKINKYLIIKWAARIKNWQIYVQKNFESKLKIHPWFSNYIK